MAQVTLYGTTGTYPSLAKDGADVKYIFYPEPTFQWAFNKKNEYEEIPFLGAPVAYDSFVSDRRIILKGTFVATTAGQPPGAKTVKERFEDLDKWYHHLSTFSAQPSATSASPEVLCLELTFPGPTTKLHFVTIDSLNVSWDGGMRHISFTLVLKEVSDVILI